MFGAFVPPAIVYPVEIKKQMIDLEDGLSGLRGLDFYKISDTLSS